MAAQSRARDNATSLPASSFHDSLDSGSSSRSTISKIPTDSTDATDVTDVAYSTDLVHPTDFNDEGYLTGLASWTGLSSRDEIPFLLPLSCPFALHTKSSGLDFSYAESLSLDQKEELTETINWIRQSPSEGLYVPGTSATSVLQNHVWDETLSTFASHGNTRKRRHEDIWEDVAIVLRNGLRMLPPILFLRLFSRFTGQQISQLLSNAGQVSRKRLKKTFCNRQARCCSCRRILGRDRCSRLPFYRSLGTATVLLTNFAAHGVCLMLKTTSTNSDVDLEVESISVCDSVQWHHSVRIRTTYLKQLEQSPTLARIHVGIVPTRQEFLYRITQMMDLSVQDAMLMLKAVALCYHPIAVAALHMIYHYHHHNSRGAPLDKTSATRVQKNNRKKESANDLERKRMTHVLSFENDQPPGNVQVATSSVTSGQTKARWACQLHKHDPDRYHACSDVNTVTQDGMRRCHMPNKHGSEGCFQHRSQTSPIRGTNVDKWRKMLINMCPIYAPYVNSLNPVFGQPLLNNSGLAEQLRREQNLLFERGSFGSGNFPALSVSEASFPVQGYTTTNLPGDNINIEQGEASIPTEPDLEASLEYATSSDKDIEHTFEALGLIWERIMIQEQSYHDELTSSSCQSLQAKMEISTSLLKSLATAKTLESLLRTIDQLEIEIPCVQDDRNETCWPVNGPFSEVRIKLESIRDEVSVFHEEAVPRYRRQLELLSNLRACCLSKAALAKFVKLLHVSNVNLDLLVNFDDVSTQRSQTLAATYTTATTSTTDTKTTSLQDRSWHVMDENDAVISRDFEQSSSADAVEYVGTSTCIDPRLLRRDSRPLFEQSPGRE